MGCQPKVSAPPITPPAPYLLFQIRETFLFVLVTQAARDRTHLEGEGGGGTAGHFNLLPGVKQAASDSGGGFVATQIKPVDEDRSEYRRRRGVDAHVWAPPLRLLLFVFSCPRADVQQGAKGGGAAGGEGGGSEVCVRARYRVCWRGGGQMSCGAGVRLVPGRTPPPSKPSKGLSKPQTPTSAAQQLLHTCKTLLAPHAPN